MATVVGIFNTEAKADDILSSLYAEDIDSDDVTLMRDAGQHGDDQIQTSDSAAAVVAPAGTTGSGTGFPVALPDDFFSTRNINDEAMNFYRQTADDGAVIIFVDTDDPDHVGTLMEKHNPTRVDKLN